MIYSSANPPELHSFPTRRSSDLFNFFAITLIEGYYQAGAVDKAVGYSRIYMNQCANELGYQLSLPNKFSGDRKSTRLNSSHVRISYAVFCLKKKIISRTRHHDSN